jgi:choline-sulfatase
MQQWTFVLAMAAALGALLPASRAADRPNILFLFADDFAYDAVGAHGNRQVRTPNLDRLAREGTTFTHCYNMGGWSGAICVASRTMLNTGRYLWNAPQKPDGLAATRAAGQFWSQSLHAAGYKTFLTGKWHLRIDPASLFDVAAHVRGGMPPDTPLAYNRPQQGKPDVWSPFDRSQGGYWTGGKHWSEVTADDAVSFLKNVQSQDAPFFLYVAFNAPHDPRQSPEEFVNSYPVESIAVPENFLPDYPYRKDIGLDNLRDENLAPHPRTREAVQVHRREYYALITHLDEQIGRILTALDATGTKKETWIFFTADHGLAVGHHGLIGKQNMYDESVRVPFFVVGPEVRAGVRNATPIYLQSVMPTTLELAGLQVPRQVEFKSLLPLLKSVGQTETRPIYGAYLQLQRMVTHDGYKLILYPKIKVSRLYNLAQDPHERNDLLEGDPDAASLSIARKLFTTLLDLQEETGDTLDLRPLYPQFGSG